MHRQVSENASFEFRELVVESTDPGVKTLHVTVLMVAAAFGHAVEFERTAYIRVDDVPKGLNITVMGAMTRRRHGNDGG